MSEEYADEREYQTPDHPASRQRAARKWRALNGAERLPDVIAGVQFIDGEKPEKSAA